VTTSSFAALMSSWERVGILHDGPEVLLAVISLD
jgi:hypothetical protein